MIINTFSFTMKSDELKKTKVQSKLVGEHNCWTGLVVTELLEKRMYFLHIESVFHEMMD